MHTFQLTGLETSNTERKNITSNNKGSGRRKEEENKNEIAELLHLTRTWKLREKCLSFQEKFEFFIHAGSCDGENRKLYDIRIKKSDIPENLRQYYLNYNEVMAECECIEMLKNDTSCVTYHNDNLIVLYISNTYALNLSKNISVQELVKKYGDIQSEKVFSLDDYKSYLLNCYVEDMLK